MWHSVCNFFLTNPSVAIFLTLGLGYLVGRFHIKSFKLGATVGVLLVGLIIGQMGKFQIAPVVKNLFFDLFIFTIGYEVGPVFIASFKKKGIKFIIQSVIFSVIAFVVSFALFKIFHVNFGEAGGIIAGSLTQSACIGTANSAIEALHISQAAKTAAMSQVAIAYALTYVFGTIGVLIFLKNIAPAIFHVNLREATKEYIETNHIKTDTKSVKISANIRVRAFRINAENRYIGKTILDFNNDNVGLNIEEIVRDGKTLTSPSTVLANNDIILVIGSIKKFADFTDKKYNLSEVDANNYPLHLKKTTILLTKVYNYNTLENMLANGVIIESAYHDDKKITDYTLLSVGDHITVIGPQSYLTNIMKNIGYEKAAGTKTDVSFLSIGIFLGILLGAIVITIHKIPLTLGGGGGALFAGLYFGWLQEKHPNIGVIPPSTRWLLKSLGLNLFIGVVGLQAGSGFVTALKEMGWLVFVIGILVSILPHLFTLLFSKFILKMNIVDNIGSLCGSGTITAALNAVNAETDSTVFALSYTPTYALGNIFLTVMAPLIVALLA
ncbi:aspartate-alanine antiporter [Lactobacillus amylovorus subsp. animalium]|uniref:aspartate-alanine antiporter n=1 Tax=Bacillota TaxID=1239 RepID=UPI0014763CC2|nr:MULTISPECIES: aspartate-alanine antiporter [Bacillota]MCI6061937.1 aspartate-alanine antiporter [Ligilactobacillus salivarius]MDY5593197.1 aspartate-alanine antiporter [Limosilactobacillus reuteri]MDD7407474.1 aspartate-alanine antiporter [Lactobacillus amylovorus]MDY5291018.1 aspartate-alanine antiporter [Ligilactobacillus salivarius]MDY5444594.1 aspartate-alanine antiporter [Lactobacillus amylovorus]